jgi:hypothetical protein
MYDRDELERVAAGVVTVGICLLSAFAFVVGLLIGRWTS